MSMLPARHLPVLPDFAELWNAIGPGLVPMLGSRLIRVEDTVDDGRYVIRAELPGIDPARDVEVSLHDGRLTIKAERTEKHEENRHSEFTYGSFVRTVVLPAGAQEEGITANYAKGILTVTVPLGEQKETVRRIEVASGE
ncbi:Hsp20/alpha crystallin family protein [Nocardia terpenica]|uniref:SHSP domain-containing protein n=1 Tax=Nocardia terpenica TaxID=455432 RepID=A0A164NTG5_9NOCA|nr:Hsp20/alpha crystallin family protein [Nocardia terpenica]KZM74708.1 hypothetical protein AWN90_21870 [Nocardia terpenica]NQE93676.1 Hsp20/alpha crystallin family protein [Nocardia terpenica]